MKCPECGVSVILSNSKYCNECGAKVEPLKPTPPKHESFTGVREIVVGLGTDFKIMPSNTNETIVTVEGPEGIKQSLIMTLKKGVLEIQDPSESVNISIGNKGGNIIANSDIFVRGNFVLGKNISIGGGDTQVSVSIMTPRGVDVSIHTSGGVECEVGDLHSNISIDTSGGLTLNADLITGFNVDVSGSVNATIRNFENGTCSLDVSGSCTLTVPAGHIKKLIVDVSGSTTLNVNAETDKAIRDVSGSLRGNLRADNVRKDVSGLDNLNVIR